MESAFPSIQRVLASQVRSLRAARRMTQEQLSEAAEIDVRHVQRIEAGEANPQLGTICLLAAALETTPAVLVALDADTSSEPGSK